MKAPKRILVIKFRHIGDVLLTAPLVSTLKQGLRDARVCVIVKHGTEAMLEGHPELDVLYVMPERKYGESKLSFHFRSLMFILELRREKFDLAINTTEGDRGILLAWLIGARDRWGLLKKGREKGWQARLLTRHFYPLERKVHTVIRNLAFAEPFGLPECREVKLHVGDQDHLVVQRLLNQCGLSEEVKLIHCHPTSRWFFKCLPTKTVAAVLDYCDELGFRVALTCAPETRERAMLDEIISLCVSSPIDLGGMLTLKQTAALSARSNFYFGVDSAPMHMAAAMGVPTVTVFGPTGAFVWGAWPNKFDGMRTPYAAMNGPQKNLEHIVIQQSWPCVPCGHAGCDGSKKSECLEQTKAGDIRMVIKQFMA